MMEKSKRIRFIQCKHPEPDAQKIIIYAHACVRIWNINNNLHNGPTERPKSKIKTKEKYVADMDFWAHNQHPSPEKTITAYA